MHKLEEIKKKLIEKMERMYDDHPDLPGNVIENIDVMAHATKNLCKIIEGEEGGEYSSRMYPMAFDGHAYGGEAYGGEAYARGRMNAKRDSMGRYSRDEGFSREDYSRGHWDTVNKIEDLIREAPDEQTRQELQRIAGRMRNS